MFRMSVCLSVCPSTHRYTYSYVYDKALGKECVCPFTKKYFFRNPSPPFLSGVVQIHRAFQLRRTFFQIQWLTLLWYKAIKIMPHTCKTLATIIEAYSVHKNHLSKTHFFLDIVRVRTYECSAWIIIPTSK